MLTALTLRDFWLEDILPFSCCPMFMLPRNPYDDWPKWWSMTDGKCRDTGVPTCRVASLAACHAPSPRFAYAALILSWPVAGAMEPLYWAPVSPVFEMTVAEARKLPQRVVWFGSMLNIPVEMARFCKPEFRNQPLIIQSNFEISAELKGLISRVVAAARDGKPAYAWDSQHISQLLALQDECLRAFDACAAESRRKLKQKAA